jgi:hypothetical protein
MRSFGGRAILAATAIAVVGCRDRNRPPPDDRPASSVPWRSHGFHAPTLRCDLDLPPGWSRSPSPMPDHIAELVRDGPPGATTIIVDERDEAGIPRAREQALLYYRSGLLTAADARQTEDAALDGAQAPAYAISIRWGEVGDGRVETLILLAFSGLPVVEMVARRAENDVGARESITAIARGARCAKL